jgi:uncharacterized membrane protein
VSAPSSSAEPQPGSTGLRVWTQAIYLLHTLSLLIGLLTSAYILTAFVFGLPSIVAVILTYARRRQAHGSWLESHFTWLLRTFWYALFWLVVATLLFGPLVYVLGDIPLLAIAYVATGLWVAYRIGRGLLALRRRLPVIAAS